MTGGAGRLLAGVHQTHFVRHTRPAVRVIAVPEGCEATEHEMAEGGMATPLANGKEKWQLAIKGK